MSFSKKCTKVFEEAIHAYHQTDHVDAPIDNRYPANSIEALLYAKSWIDTVQWHLEDIIRDPQIQPEAALQIKRRIDKSNQDRTDLVEFVDSYFLDIYKNEPVLSSATFNTESPAWAVDRLSILLLKVFHMQAEVNRTDTDSTHKQLCAQKLQVLIEQQKDLCLALDQLLDDYATGKKYMKVYKQMKMYNDPALNPVLYGKH